MTQPQRKRWHSFWPILLMLIPLLSVGFWPAFHNDSAYVSLRSALSLRAGQGFFFDTLDESVRPLLQSPLYVLVVAGLSLPMPAASVEPIGLVITALGWGAMSIALYYVAAALGRQETGYLVALLASTSPLLVTLAEPSIPWALCLSWLFIWQIWQATRDDSHTWWLPMLALLLPTTAFRPDSLLLQAFMSILYGFYRRVIPVRMLVFSLVGVTISSWINRHVINELWTMLPLQIEGWWRWWRHWMVDQSLLLAIAAVGWVLWVVFCRAERPLIFILTAWLGAALATQLEATAGSTLLLFAVMGIHVPVAGMLRRSWLPSFGTSVVVIPLLLGSLLLALHLETWIMLYQQRPLDRWGAETDAATWLAADNVPEARLLSSARLAVLADQWAAVFASPDNDDQQIRFQLEDEAWPDYVVLSDSNDWLRLTGGAWFLDQYVPLQSFPLVTSSAPLTIWGYRDSLHAIGQRQLLHAVSPKGLELVGYDAAGRPMVPGEILPITLFLRPRWPLERSIHLVGRVDRFGTSESITENVIEIPQSMSVEQWSPAVVISETLTLALPTDVSYGAYVVTVSFHDGPGTPLWPIYRDGDENVLDRVSLSLLTQPWIEDTSGATKVEARFDQTILLESFEVADRTWTPGAMVALDLYWRTSELPKQDYFVFIHLIAESGELVLNENQQPMNGLFPMEAWYPGTLLRDPHTLLVPKTLPAGQYRLQLGLFDLATGARLPVVDSLGQPAPDLSLPLMLVTIQR